MADSFFGFGTEMPALGAGKAGEYDEGLLEPDDEIDMFNDETFGDGALFGEDWEEAHEVMAGQHQSGAHLYDSQPDSWMKQELRDSPPNELESSLNKLVKEDEESASRAQNIPGVAGHANIWGSPGQTPPVHTPKQQHEDGLKSLLKQMQQVKHPAAHISTSLPKAITLEQLESSMQGPRPVVPSGTVIPRALTVEELERQMTGEQPVAPGRAQGISMNAATMARGPSPPNPHLPIGTPPQRASLPQALSGGMPNGSVHSVRPGMPGQSHSQHRPVPPPNQGFYPGFRRHTVADGFSLSRSLHNAPLSHRDSFSPSPPPIFPNHPQITNRQSPLNFLLRAPSPTPVIALADNMPQVHAQGRSHTDFKGTSARNLPITTLVHKPPVQPGGPPLVKKERPLPPLAHTKVVPSPVEVEPSPPLAHSKSSDSDPARRYSPLIESQNEIDHTGTLPVTRGITPPPAHVKPPNLSITNGAHPPPAHTKIPNTSSIGNHHDIQNDSQPLLDGFDKQIKTLTTAEKKIADVLIEAKKNRSPPLTEQSVTPRVNTASPDPEHLGHEQVNRYERETIKAKTSLAMAILNGIMGRQRTLSGGGSPMTKSHIDMAGSPSQAHRMPGPHTPQQQRIPPGHAHTDPSHHRGHRDVHHQGPPHGPSNHLKQNLFQDRRGFDGPVNGSSARHDQYMGRGEPSFRPHHPGGGPDHAPYGPPHRGGGDYRHGHPPHGRGGFVPNGRGYPPPGPRGPGFHGDDRGYYSRDRDGHYYPDRGRGGPPPPSYYDEREYRKRGPGEHFMYKQRQMVGPSGDGDDESRDSYAGLMSKKEKDWIIKIQLMQLQTDNPYLDDYYYTMWQIKKLAEAREEETKRKDGSKGPSLVLPQLAGRVETKAYMPVQFDNSLGRLTAASVHNPRQIIDLRRDNSQEKEDQKGREVKRFKQLLLDVENAYDVLLVIVDMEKRADALPEEQRSTVYEDRRKYIHSLYISLHLDNENVDYFERLVTLRKGIKLVARLIPLLQQDDAIVVTRELLRYTADFMNKKGWSRDVLPQVLAQVSVIVSASKLEHLVQYCASLQGDRPSLQISSALQNQFGSSVIWCLVSRGEAIYKHESPLDLDVQHQKQWCSFVESVADCLAAGDSEMPQNKVGSQHASDITEHFKRLLDRGSFLSIEDKLSELSGPLSRES